GDRNGSAPVVYWCFEGHGIQRTNNPETWIDADKGIGRGQRLMNADAYLRSPSALYRTLEGRRGTRGLLDAKYVVADKTDGEGLVVRLVVSEGQEPSLAVVANLGLSAELAEFVDNGYEPGITIEAMVTLNEPSFVRGAARGLFAKAESLNRGPGMYMPTQLQWELSSKGGSSDPLTAWNCISADCDWIRIKSSPDTTIARTGSRNLRRSPLATAAPDTTSTTDKSTSVAPTIDDVYADRSHAQGTRVRWEGSLDKVRTLDDGVHLLIGVTGSKLKVMQFEAYTKSFDVVNEIDDFWTKEDRRTSSRQDGDRVAVEGIVLAPGAAGRLSTKADKCPLLELRAITRVGSPSSRVVPDRHRAASTIASDECIAPVQKLWRNPPQAGKAVEFVAVFQSFDQNARAIRIKPLKSDYRTILVQFQSAGSASFGDYEDNDEVAIVAIGPADVTDHQITLIGQSIVRTKNPLSRVTATGRLTAAIDSKNAEEKYRRLKTQIVRGTAPDGERVTLVGEYADRKQGSEGPVLAIKRGFSTEEYSCNDSEELRELLGRHSVGSELLLELVVVTPEQPKQNEETDKPESGRARTREGRGGRPPAPPRTPRTVGRDSSTKQRLELNWIAWIGEPDKRVQVRK
ncbi:MAG: hypothetical protein JNG88_12360, partial [Phycisphaerales bacterium]|nr:hypothetical protein [Phycisphaerales bacterium]